MRLPKDEHCSILKFVISHGISFSIYYIICVQETFLICREKTLQILMILALLLFFLLIQKDVPCAATLLLAEQIKSHHGFTLS